MEVKNFREKTNKTKYQYLILRCLIIILLILIFKLDRCDYCDYVEYFGNGYWYMDEGGDSKAIFGSKALSPKIPSTVIEYKYDNDYIVAKQKPKLPQDILYDVNYIYKDGIDTFYWIISAKNYFGLGPLDRQEYETAMRKYGVSDKLRIN